MIAFSWGIWQFLLFSAIFLSAVNGTSNVPGFPPEEKKKEKKRESWAPAAHLQSAVGTKSQKRWEGGRKTSGNGQETGKAVGEGAVGEWEQKGARSGKLRRSPVGETSLFGGENKGEGEGEKMDEA